MTTSNLTTLGLRHLALNVNDPQLSKKFYTDVLKMKVEWEPDADNVYLTSGGQDNLALHRAPPPSASSSAPGNSDATASRLMDHIGFALASPADVDAWFGWMTSRGVKILRDIKTHRDGARSFYISDPDGVVIQMIYHPPISAQALIK